MYLYMFIDYVVLRTCDYDYVLVHVYILYMLMHMLCHIMICNVDSIQRVSTT